MNREEYKKLFPVGLKVRYQDKEWTILSGDWSFGDIKLFIHLVEAESSRSRWIDYDKVELP
jgi:hypothetical protein